MVIRYSYRYHNSLLSIPAEYRQSCMSTGCVINAALLLNDHVTTVVANPSCSSNVEVEY